MKKYNKINSLSVQPTLVDNCTTTVLLFD
jgi:hypothetical protein